MSNINLPYMGKCRITKLYGTPPPAGKKYSTGKHSGIDIVGMEGKLIFPIMGGVVFKTGIDKKGWGKYMVMYQHDGLFAIHAHLSKIACLPRDVTMNDSIGVEGATGNVTGAHLHLEIRKDYWNKDSTIDPAEYLGIKNKLGVVEMKEKEQTASEWAAADWEWAEKQGLLDGTRPKDPVSREELAAILHRLCNLS